jgi:hypothetical protein
MNQKLLLSLIAVPTLAGSMLAMLFVHLASAAEGASAQQAHVARQANALISEPASCSFPTQPEADVPLSLQSVPHNGTLVASAAIEIPVEMPPEAPLEYPVLDFSAAESDAAVALFGCDCPACINALRQLRRQPPAPMVMTSRRLTPDRPAISPSGPFATGGQLVASRHIVPGNQIPGSQLASTPPAAPIAEQDVSNPVQGHCWVNLQRRSTPEDIQNVLQTLEAEEANQ